MNTSLVCVDANVIVKLVVPETYREQALRLWQTWAERSVRIVAPRLLQYEVTNVLRKKVARGQLLQSEAEEALDQALDFRVEMIDSAALAKPALRLADRLGLPAAYDCHYLAVAERLDCAFWTADERLFNGVKGSLGRVRWIGEA
jgi:predicted nucleic acid-binding protein